MAYAVSPQPPQSVRLFTKSEEALFLGIPLIFLFVAAIWLGSHSNPDLLGWSRRTVDFLMLTIGLQTAHNAFTLSLIWLPELRSWIKDKKALENKRMVSQWTLICIAIALILFPKCIFVSASKAMKISFLNNASIFDVITLAFFMMTFWHTLSQYFGLSSLYNRTYLSTTLNGKAPPPSLLKLFQLEQKAYKVFILVFSLYLSWRLVFPPSLFTRNIFAVLAWLAIVVILVPACFMPFPLRRAKLIFSMRNFLVALIPLNPLAAIGCNLNHNFEYWLVYKKMIKNSRLQRRLLFCSLSLAGITTFVLIALVRNREHIIPQWLEAHPSLHGAIYAFTLTVTTLHYFIDGYIFHFSDPLTRQHISPLLMPTPVDRPTDIAARPVHQKDYLRVDLRENQIEQLNL